MIIVSYIDILDFIGVHRQCLIDGEELFNANGVKNVCVISKGGTYDVSAKCSTEAARIGRENAAVSIQICKGTQNKLEPTCTCKAEIAGKCGHVVATLIYLHRHPLEKLLEDTTELARNVNEIEECPVQNPKNDDEAPPLVDQRQRRLTRRYAAYAGVEGTALGEEKVVQSNKDGSNIKVEREPVPEEGYSENHNPEEDDEDCDADDWGPSSDEDWEPVNIKKRTRKEDSVFPDKEIYESPQKKQKTKRKTKSSANIEARDIVTNLKRGDDNKFHCPSCEKSTTNLEKLHNHIRDVHILNKGSLTCSKCDRSFKLKKTLRLHSCDGDDTSNDEEEMELSKDGMEGHIPVKAELEPLSPPSSPEPDVSPQAALQCVLCPAQAESRLAMQAHYLTVHEQDRAGVIVCDRCGEFRLLKDHICPSVIEFQCYMCKSSFKAGRDYWNHLIRNSKKHAGRHHRARCGWPSCAERFTSEADLLGHMRLHLPENVQLMCSVCNLILRNSDAKLVHMEKHDVGVYECCVCRAAFEDKQSLKEHWDAHKEDRPYQCEKCGWRFISSIQLDAHTRKFHEGGPFTCAKCPQKFDDKTDVRIHFGAAHGKIRCTVCSFRCASKPSLERHMAKKHGAESSCLHCEEGPFDAAALKAHMESRHREALHTCSTCGQVFTLQRTLKAHLRTHMDGIVCNDCDKTFKSQRDLDEHRRMHTGEKPFICAECGMTFKRAQNLEYHMKGAHKNERNFVCPECGKRFISNADMKRHLRYNHQGGKKWHLCPECGHRLPSLYNLKLHVQSKHTGERPHRCPLCAQGFVASSDLKKHILFKHRKEHPFSCDKCQKRYQRKRDLQVHLQRHHGDQLFRCKECGKKFESYASMMQHSRYHTTEEPFQCAKCGRRFPHKMNLSRHLCTPEIKKNFHCHTCGLNFTTSGSLKSHRRRLHGGDTSQPPPAPPDPPAQPPMVEHPDLHAEQLVDGHAQAHPNTHPGTHPGNHADARDPSAFEADQYSKEKIWRSSQQEQGQQEAWSEPLSYHELSAAPGTQDTHAMHLLHSQGHQAHAHHTVVHTTHAHAPLQQHHVLRYSPAAGPPPPQATQAPTQQHHHQQQQTTQVPHLSQAQQPAETHSPHVEVVHNPALLLKGPPALVSLPGKPPLDSTPSPSHVVTYVQTIEAPQQPGKMMPVSPTTVNTVNVVTAAPAAAPATSSGGLILGAPIQTTSDGSFHLVFVPHGNQK